MYFIYKIKYFVGFFTQPCGLNDIFSFVFPVLEHLSTHPEWVPSPGQHLPEAAKRNFNLLKILKLEATTVVYFNQLPGAVRTQKLVKTLFRLFSNFFVIFKYFTVICFLKSRKKVWKKTFFKALFKAGWHGTLVESLSFILHFRWKITQKHFKWTKKVEISKKCLDKLLFVRSTQKLV